MFTLALFGVFLEAAQPLEIVFVQLLSIIVFVWVHVVVELKDNHLLYKRFYSKQLPFHQINICWEPDVDIKDLHIGPQTNAVFVASVVERLEESGDHLRRRPLCSNAVLGTSRRRRDWRRSGCRER